MIRWLSVGLVVAGLLVGLLAGYLYWGRPLASLQGGLQQAQTESEAERAALTRSLRETEARLKTTIAERERLERALTEGRK